MGRLRQKCGAVTGEFMVLGLKYGNMETKLIAYKKVRELNSLIEKEYGPSNCFEILKQHATSADVEARKHHNIICRKEVGDASGFIYDLIHNI